MSSKTVFILIVALALFLFSCGKNKNSSTANGEQVVSSSATAEDSDINATIPVDEQPYPINQPVPKYPQSAQQARIEGAVYVKALVTKEGRVKKAVVIQREGGSPELEQSALEAMQQSTFRPAKKNGEPVTVWVVIPYKYKLK